MEHLPCVLIGFILGWVVSPAFYFFLLAFVYHKLDKAGRIKHDFRKEQDEQ